jgi:quinolinate synthase
MKLNTLEKVYLALLYEIPEIQMEETLRVAAKIPMDRMMEISIKAGLVG